MAASLQSLFDEMLAEPAGPELRDTDRERALEALSGERFDLVIVGGGITGAALALLATACPSPLRVALLEVNELAAGTSSRSSRFLHGGLRYLAHGRLGLVRRLLAGRAELAALAPELVRPAPFLLPLGAHTPHASWLLRSSLWLYGALERRGPKVAGIAPVARLDRAAALRAEPFAAHLADAGALTYGELAVDDAGLVRALARRAAAAGACVVTRIGCEGLVRAGRHVVGVRASDRATGRMYVVRARAVVDATGPWSGRLDRARRGSAGGAPLRLSRGTHILVPRARLPLAHTLVFFEARDGRALFAAPRGAEVLVGTTDVEHHGAPDAVAPTRAEVSYLLRALAAAVPSAQLSPADVAGAYAGVRPLATGRGDTGALDRGYVVQWDEPGLLALRGGKLTLALDGARHALRALLAQAGPLRLPAFTVPAPGMLAPGFALAALPAGSPANENATSAWRAA